jgi:hypothetical protein
MRIVRDGQVETEGNAPRHNGHYRPTAKLCGRRMEAVQLDGLDCQQLLACSDADLRGAVVEWLTRMTPVERKAN